MLRPGEYERQKKRGFEYKYRDSFGHQHTLSALTLKELRDKEDALAKDKVDGISTTKQRQTVNDYYELWKHQSRNLKSNTFSNYCWEYDTFISQTIGKKKLATLKESDIREFYNALHDKGMAITTMDGIQTILHQVIEVAVRDDAVRRNVTDNALKKFKQAHPPQKKKALTPAELTRFREVIKDTVWYPVFEVLSWTGMRVGEVTALTWDDVDYEANCLHINKTLVYYKDIDGEMRYTINSTKTPASFRDVPLNRHITKALEYQKEHCPKCNDKILGVTNFIFGNRFHHVHTQSTLNRAIKRIIKDANIQKDAKVLLPDFSCHTMRRTYATNLVRAGVSIPVTMALLGHSDYETTVTVYTDVQKDMLALGDEKLLAWMSGQNVAQKDTETYYEYEELRHQADEATEMKRIAEGILRRGGMLDDAAKKKLMARGIDVEKLISDSQNSPNKSRNNPESVSASNESD